METTTKIRRTFRWRTVAVLATGVAIGTVIVATPATSHVGGSVKHLWKHVRAQADKQYVKRTEIVQFRRVLSFGEAATVVRNGPIRLVAECRENITTSGQDEVRLLAATSRSGSFMQGDTPHGGLGVQAPSDTVNPYLNTDTPADQRVMGGIVTRSGAPDEPAADDDIDTGFVAGPKGEYIGIDETTMYALHVAGADCLVVGHAQVSK